MSSKQEEKDEELKLPWKKGLPGWVHILIHIGLIVVVSLLLLWGTMLFLKGYTRYGQAIKTPDVVGLTQENAMEILEQANLYLEVVDSVYVEGKAPGTILDTTPRAGSRIKPQRTIFATVNTVSVKSIKLPQFEELSERSVEMMLRGAGFKHISSEYVPGQHHLLVLRIKDDRGRYLQAGDRVPYNTPLIMEVSSAELYETALMDSLQVLGTTHEEVDEPETTGEDWF